MEGITSELFNEVWNEEAGDYEVQEINLNELKDYEALVNILEEHQTELMEESVPFLVLDGVIVKL